MRDRFKASGRMLAMLTAPGATLPNELAQDVLVLDEPLPLAEDLKGIVRSVFSDAKMDEPDAAVVEKAVDALIGLAAFPAEQSLAMSLSRTGLDTEGLWERKRQTIEQTPGLSVWRGGETFDDIGGVENVRRFLRYHYYVNVLLRKCHSERSEESAFSPFHGEIPRSARNDSGSPSSPSFPFRSLSRRSLC